MVERAVFDRGRSSNPSFDGNALNAGGPNFRCTDADKRPPRSIVTAAFLGDPKPDRVVPEIPQSPVFSRRRWDEPILKSPIHLTFRAMRAAEADQTPEET